MTEHAEPDLTLGGGLTTLVDMRPSEGSSTSQRVGPSSFLLEPGAFRVQRLLAREHPVYGVPTPFVGRREVLEATYNLIRDAVNTRRLHTVSLVGPVGVGKTRLLAEAFAIVDPVARGIEVLAAASVPMEGPEGLSCVAQILRRRFQVQGVDTDEMAVTRIRRGLESLVDPGQVVTATRLLAFLCGLTTPESTGPVAASPSKLEARALKVFVDLMRHHGRLAPQILVLHRAGDLTPRFQEVLTRLFEALEETPTVVFFIGADPAPASLLEASPRHREVALAPLEEADMTRLARAVLRRVQDLPDALVEDMVERSAGLPCLLEDNIRLLVQRGVLVPGEDAWTIHRARKGHRRSLATSAASASRARVEALEGATREVMEMAAVFGPACWRSGLVSLWRTRPVASEDHVVPWSRDDREARVDAILKEALSQELLHRHPQSALDGQEELAFVSAADREVLYGGIEEARRQRYHRLVAQWFEGLDLADPKPWHEVIAHHLDRGGAPVRAAERYLAAGEAARDAFDVAGAKALLQQALANVDVDHVALLARVLLAFGEVSMVSGAYEDARRLFGALLEASLIADDPWMGAKAWLESGRARRALGEFGDARGCLDHARRLFAQSGDEEGVARTLAVLAEVVTIGGASGAIEEARGLLEEALAIRRRLGDRSAVAESLGLLAVSHFVTGDVDAAASFNQEALGLKRALGDMAGQAYCLLTVGNIAYAREDREAALDAWGKALDLSLRIGHRDLQGRLQNNIGELCVALGWTDDAATALGAAREIVEETGDLRAQAEVLRNLAALSIRLGRWDEALERVDASISLCRQVGSKYALGQALRTRGEILAHHIYEDGTAPMVKAGEAAQTFQKAIEVLEAAGGGYELAQTLKSYGQHLVERGERTRGERMLARAKDVGAG